MDIKSIIKNIRDRLTRKSEETTPREPANGYQAMRDFQINAPVLHNQNPTRTEDIYSELMQKVEDRPVRSCNNCKYHHPLMCAVHPYRSTSHFFANDCKDWEVIKTNIVLSD